VGPLALSSRPAVAEVGAALALLLVIAALLSSLLVPALARWFSTLMGRQPKRLYRR
jgi:cytochrome bd-type quinol oxidase subunit 1